MDSRAALVTGGASGIGKCIVENLAANGYSITVLDLDRSGLEQLATQAAAKGWAITCSSCDVRDYEAQAAAFSEHMDRYGRLDAVLLIAGIGERGDFLTVEPSSYEATLDIDLRAVISGVRLAAKAMMQQGRGGHIVSVASAAGFFPVPAGPIYAAAKAGVIHLTRSLAPRFAPHGISISTVCPQYVDTPLVHNMLRDNPQAAKAMMGPLFGAPLLPPQKVADVVAGLLQQQLPQKGAAVDYTTELAGAGCVYLILQNGKLWDPWARKQATTAGAPGTSSGSSSRSGQGSGSSSGSSLASPVRRYSPQALLAFARATAEKLPGSYRKLQVVRLSPNFKEAVQVVAVQMPGSIPPGHVLVRRLFVGINASDINYTSGRYHGSTAAAQRALPYDAGFESVGVVVASGPAPATHTSSSSSSGGSRSARGMEVGQAVAAMDAGFAEYAVVPINRVLSVPSPTPEVVALMTSGLTAAIALEQVGGLTIPPPAPTRGSSASGVVYSPLKGSSGSSSRGGGRQAKSVLVTAAAGGTGQFAVQLAKLAGCHVVATCGGEDKAQLLRRLGVDRVINYRAEDVKSVLKSEYPKGVDLIYESVGGSMFDLCVDALAPQGTLIIIGMMSAYQAGWPRTKAEGLPEKLLWKSATVAGFFLLKFAPLWGPYLERLVDLVAAGKLAVALDSQQFSGLEAVADAVERLQSGASSGKVVVQLSRELPAAASARM